MRTRLSFELKNRDSSVTHIDFYVEILAVQACSLLGTLTENQPDVIGTFIDAEPSGS